MHSAPRHLDGSGTLHVPDPFVAVVSHWKDAPAGQDAENLSFCQEQISRVLSFIRTTRYCRLCLISSYLRCQA
jgi:hypothetical protein